MAAVYGGPIYISTNSGAAWTITTAPNASGGDPDNLWSSVASSADGMVLLAGDYGSYGGLGSGVLYASTNGGAVWIQGQGSRGSWESVASSSAGDKLIGVASARANVGGPRPLICTSTNAGATWASNNVPDAYEPYWRAVASSADGTRLAAACDRIFISTNAGATWTAAGAPAARWACTSMSANGTRMVAVPIAFYGYDGSSVPGTIYISSDSGATWEPTTAPSNNWVSVASSADGLRLVAAVNGGLIYSSSDAGVTWMATAAPSNQWCSVASSADGCRIFAASGGYFYGQYFRFEGAIYTFQITPAPQLRISSLGSQSVLSWIVPSAHFILQENGDLTTANWTDVATAPILSFTNLQYEVSAPASSASRFYRLKGFRN